MVADHLIAKTEMVRGGGAGKVSSRVWRTRESRLLMGISRGGRGVGPEMMGKSRVSESDLLEIQESRGKRYGMWLSRLMKDGGGVATMWWVLQWAGLVSHG